MGNLKCYICEKEATEHHIFYGWGDRPLSEKYHLVIPLCHWHHTGQYGVHFYDKLHRNKFQKEVCEHLGLDFFEVISALNNKHQREYLEKHKKRLGEIRKARKK